MTVPALGQVVEVDNLPRESWTLSEVGQNAERPNLRADLIRRGYDGNIYTAQRVVTGRKRARVTWLLFVPRSGLFVTFL